ncbi:unnamed protein product, partial [Amoebophrya sp. A25]
EEPRIELAVKNEFRNVGRNTKKTISQILAPAPTQYLSPDMIMIQQALVVCSTTSKNIADIPTGANFANALADQGGLDGFTDPGLDLLNQTSGALKAEQQTTRAGGANMLKGLSKANKKTTKVERKAKLEAMALVCVEHGIIKAKNDRGPPLTLRGFKDWIETNHNEAKDLECLDQFYQGIKQPCEDGNMAPLVQLKRAVLTQEPPQSVMRKYFTSETIAALIDAAVTDQNQDKLRMMVVDPTNDAAT